MSFICKIKKAAASLYKFTFVIEKQDILLMNEILELLNQYEIDSNVVMQANNWIDKNPSTEALLIKSFQ